MVVVTEELPVTKAAAPDVRVRDDALARRLVAGEPGAFEEVVEAYGPKVSRLACRLLGWSGGAGEVEDVVQDVFVSVLRHARRFDGRSSLSTWITSIALNRCRSLRRRVAARVRTMAKVIARVGRETLDDPADQAAIRDDESERVRWGVRRLRRADREVIVLHYLEHAPVDAIAQILGVSKNAVEVRLHRARGRLKAILEDSSRGRD